MEFFLNINIYAWFALSNLLFSFVIGVLVFLNNPKRKVIQTFFFMNMAIVFWSFGYFMWQISTTYVEAIFWVRILSIGSTLIPPFFLHWALSVIDLHKKRKKIIGFFYILSAVFLLFSFTDLYVKDLVQNSYFEYWPRPGILYSIYLFFSYIPIVLYGTYLIFRKYLASSGVKRLRLKWMAYGTVLSFLGASSNFPLWYNIPIPPVLNFLVATYSIFFAYSISKYRFMDLRSVITRSITFGFLILVVTGIFASVSSLVGVLFGNLVGFQSNLLTGLVVGIIVSMTYKYFLKFFEILTNKFLFKKSYNPDELLVQVSGAAASILELQKLLKTLSKILGDAMQFEKIGFAFVTPEGNFKIAYKQGFKPGVAEQLISYPNVVTSFVKELERNPTMLVIDEMYTQYENGEYQPIDPDLLKMVHQNNIAVVIPLRSKNDLVGIVVLGSKKSGDQYTHQDITTLDIFAGQATVAIENARLYDELKYFNIKLAEEVKVKTTELRKANVQLKRLDQAKSDFISIASHQLRTPLTIIKGYISMMQEGSFGKVPKKIDDNLSKVFLSNERLIALVDNLLDISRIESGRQKFEWTKVDFVELAQRLTENMVGNAKSKGLKLTFVKPKEKIPQIIGEYNKLHDVIINFVDNAIKYTPKGKIDVTVEAKPAGMLTFCVKDTGRGIDPEVLAHLFQKFSRGKGSFQVNTGGSGLGLYVARMVVEAHEGKIWAESAGRDKGAAFCFSIPISGPKDKKDLPYAQPGQKVTNPVKSSARGVPKIPEKPESKQKKKK